MKSITTKYYKKNIVFYNENRLKMLVKRYNEKCLPGKRFYFWTV